MLTTLARWWNTRGQIDALSHLDDRLLEDAGVDRTDIPRRVRGATRDDRPARSATKWPALYVWTERAGRRNAENGLCA
jgi:uncharacterized protein YjiS (DUF1127 family)